MDRSCGPEDCPKSPARRGRVPPAYGQKKGPADGCCKVTCPRGPESFSGPAFRPAAISREDLSQSPPISSDSGVSSFNRTRSSTGLSWASRPSSSEACFEDVCITKVADYLRRERGEELVSEITHVKKRLIQSLDSGISLESPTITIVTPPAAAAAAAAGAAERAPSTTSIQPEDFEVDDEEGDDAPAEVAAAMLHSEERGFLMHSEPTRIYSTLFEDPDELMLVTTASPNPMQDVVVPVPAERVPFTPSHENMTLSASISTNRNKIPSTSIFTKKMQELGLYDNLVQSGRLSTKIAEDNDVDLMIDSTSYNSVPLVAPPDSLEVLLDTAVPAHFSRVQLRGSVPPTWFPGYFEALPFLPDMTDITDCPVSVMEEAWESVIQM